MGLRKDKQLTLGRQTIVKILLCAFVCSLHSKYIFNFGVEMRIYNIFKICNILLLFIFMFIFTTNHSLESTVKQKLVHS